MDPLGATAAALLFGFAASLQTILATPQRADSLVHPADGPVPGTIVAVAGLVGRVRPPKADGKPYMKA